jgi:hypothetical protein
MSFVIIWLILLFMRRNVLYANLMTSTAKIAFSETRMGEANSQTFSDISKSEEFYNWLRGPMQKALFTNVDYNNASLPEKEQFHVLNTAYPIGKLELKQYRVTNDSCKLSGDTLNTRPNMTHMYYIPECYGFYSSKNRDKSPYGPAAGNESAIDDGSGFTFHAKTKGEFSVFINGNFGNYPSIEAYIREIEFGDQQGYDDAIDFLEENGWVDRGTRAVIISVLLYMPNFDSYVACQFVVEIPPSGLMYPFEKYRVRHTQRCGVVWRGGVVLCCVACGGIIPHLHQTLLPTGRANGNLHQLVL